MDDLFVPNTGTIETMKMLTECSAPECGRPSRARGMCMMHYKRVLRIGRTELLTTPERFWGQVSSHGKCWEWTGGIDENGYGRFEWSENGRKMGRLAHRYSILLHGGSLDGGKVVDHLCHNRKCVNPDHLRVVSQGANTQNRRGPQRNNTLGVRGVERLPSGNYRAVVSANGKRHYSKVTDSLTEAAEAAEQMRRALHDQTGIAA